MAKPNNNVQLPDPEAIEAIEAIELPLLLEAMVQPEFDTSEAHFALNSSTGAGLRAVIRQSPRYMDC